MNWKRFKQIPLLLIVVCLSSLSSADIAWIDVRSPIEQMIDRIDGDVRISSTDIVKEVSAIFPDKNTKIHLYCRSGARSGSAMAVLKRAGYKNVSNVGSINNVRKERGLIK